LHLRAIIDQVSQPAKPNTRPRRYNDYLQGNTNTAGQEVITLVKFQSDVLTANGNRQLIFSMVKSTEIYVDRPVGNVRRRRRRWLRIVGVRLDFRSAYHVEAMIRCCRR
jgi:hypothetical protein